MKTHFHKPLKSERGFSIVSAVMGSAILAIAIAAFAQFMATQYKSVRRINQKFATLKTEQLLGRSLADPFVCNCIMNNLGTASFVPDPAGKIAVSALKSAGGTCAPIAGGNPTGIATQGTWLNDDSSLGVFVTNIYIGDISGGTPLPAAPPLPPRAEHNAEVYVEFGNNPAGDSTMMAAIRPAQATVNILVESGTTIVGCAGSSFDRYFANAVQTHDTQLGAIRVDANNEIIRVQNEIPAAVTTATNLIDVERQRIVKEARDLLSTLTPPPPPPTPPPGPSVDCTGFTGAASLAGASHFLNDAINVSGNAGTPAGTTAFEFQVNGIPRGSISSGSSGTAGMIVNTYTGGGVSVNVRVVAIDTNGCRSSPSGAVAVIIP